MTISPIPACIVIAAGEPWVKGDTRMDFIRKNVNVLESIVPEIAKRRLTEAIFPDRLEPCRYPDLCCTEIH